MNFIEALRLARQGKRIKNKQWSVSTYIFETHGDILYEGGAKYSFFLPHMLNDDWEIYEEKPKTYTFQEAFEAFTKGHTISRVDKTWWFSKVKNYYTDTMFSPNDIRATDWVIVKEPLAHTLEE